MGLQTEIAINKLSNEFDVNKDKLSGVSRLPVSALLKLVIAACDDGIKNFEEYRIHGGGLDLPTYDALIELYGKIKNNTKTTLETWGDRVDAGRKKYDAERSAAWEQLHQIKIL